MNAITTTQDTKAVALYSGSSLVPRNMDEAIRLAEFMCRARTLPKHLWDSPGDCLMVVELAMRWGMSPFAVAQATSVISGKQMIEGKLVAAACESVGAIVGQFDYSFTGEGDDRSITVTATRRGETNARTVTVKLADAKTANQMWVKQPDQQLVYHGVRVWARRWTPAVILGVYSKEEWGQTIDGEIVADEHSAINEAVPLKPAAAATQRAERKVDPTVYAPPPKPTSATDRWAAPKKMPAEMAAMLDERDVSKWLINLEMLLGRAVEQTEVVEIGDDISVKNALKSAPAHIKDAVNELLGKAFGRFAEPKEDEVLITGEHNVMAGD